MPCGVWVSASVPGPVPVPLCAQSFLSALEWFEGVALTRHASGPYLLGDSFSLLDIMTISSMERLAAGGVGGGERGARGGKGAGVCDSVHSADRFFRMQLPWECCGTPIGLHRVLWS